MKTNYNSCKINVEIKVRSIQYNFDWFLQSLPGLFNARRTFVFEKYSPLEVNQVLFQFCEELRKADGSKYELGSLRVMQLD